MSAIVTSSERRQLTRRTFLALAAAGAAGLAARGTGLARASVGTLPVTGAANPGLEPFDRLMTSFVEQNKVPGAALAVTRASRLVYARGFGCADVEKHEPVQPDALFRIASVSKPITAVAVMQLVERQKLKLDDQVVDIMKLSPLVARREKPDARWNQITVRHCLQHTGGWDRGKSFDPIGRPWQIAKAFGAEVTAVCSTRNLEQARKLGADHVIDYTQEDFTQNGRHYDLILAIRGYRSIFEYKRALSPGGTYVMVGGSWSQIFQPIFLGPLVFMTGGKKLGQFNHRPNQKDLVLMKELIEAGKVAPVIDRRYPLSEVPEALRYYGQGHARGKVVITLERNNEA